MIAKLLNYTIKFNFISGYICATKISVPKERTISFLVDNFLLPDKDKHVCCYITFDPIHHLTFITKT